MPNTLAHYGVQGILARGVFPPVDVRWILVGCVLPDVPWILQRVVRALPLVLSPYDLRLYSIGQASLVVTLVLCAALAVPTSRRILIFSVLASGSLGHLLLDSLQTKWGNGVQLAIPFAWDDFNLGWFWPESGASYVLTGLGICFLIFVLRHGPPRETLFDSVTRKTLTSSLGLIAVYVTLPLFLSPTLREHDSHYVSTLEDLPDRVGRPVAFDRARLTFPSNEPVLVTFAGEPLTLEGVEPEVAGIVSIRGHFTGRTTVRPDQIHVHRGSLRDLPSYVGLLVLAVLLTWPRVTPAHPPAERRRSGARATKRP